MFESQNNATVGAQATPELIGWRRVATADIFR